MSSTVLVADDSLTTRIIVEKNLIDWGYESIVVDNGEDAWDVMSKADAPEIAIIDWMMPGIDGVELCKKIKSNHDDKLVFVIILTTRDDKADMQKGFSAGADDYLTKPVNSVDLHSRITAGQRILDYDKRLREQERTIRIECYNALTELAEARDNETGAHIKRIGSYASKLARALGCDKKFVEDIEIFAPMHDIGKVGISDSILLAPRKLTDEEFVIMKTHAELGWHIVQGRSTLEMAAEICLSHHERWDGTGYPYHLAGETIPLAARITSIADVYDALRSVRPYKDGWTHEKTVEYMEEQSGTQFDPELIEVFLSMQDEFAEVFDTIKDEEADDGILGRIQQL